MVSMICRVQAILLLAIYLTSGAAYADQIKAIYLPKGVLAVDTPNGIIGAFPDILNEAARRLGRDVKLRSVAWKRSQILVKKEPGAAIAPITRVPARESSYIWISDLLPLTLTFLIPSNSPLNPQSIDQLQGLRVAIMRGAVAEVLHNQSSISPQAFINNSDRSIIEMIKRDRADGWLIWDIVGLETIRKEKIADQFKATFKHQVGQLYLATNDSISNQEVDLWRSTLEQMKAEGYIRDVLDRYYGNPALGALH